MANLSKIKRDRMIEFLEQLKAVHSDDDSIRATVVDDRHIEYEGVTTSLSALAQRIKGFDHPVQGPLWFTYNGRILADIRGERLEKNNND